MEPALHYLFDRDKSLVPRVGTGTLSMVRAETVNEVDASGVLQLASANTARFGHNPLTGQSLGLLLEEPRTQIAPEPEDMTAWDAISGGVTITQNNALAPDGTMSMDLLQRIDSANDGLLDNFALANSTVYVASIFIYNDDASRSRVRVLDITSSLDASITINWTAGVPSVHASANATDIRFEEFPNDRYRLTFNFTSHATETTHRMRVQPEVLETGTEGCHFWGANITEGDFPIAYQPGTGHSVEVCSHTDMSFLDALQTVEGTVYLRYTKIGSVTDARPVAFGNATSNVIEFRENGLGKPSGRSANTGGDNCFLDGTIVADNIEIQYAFRYRDDDCLAAQDGVQQTADVSATFPLSANATEFHFGTRLNDTFPFSGYIAEFAYYAEAMEDAELIALSSNGPARAGANANHFFGHVRTHIR